MKESYHIQLSQTCFDNVVSVQNEDYVSEFSSYALKLPALLFNNGLYSTLIYLLNLFTDKDNNIKQRNAALQIFKALLCSSQQVFPQLYEFEILYDQNNERDGNLNELEKAETINRIQISDDNYLIASKIALESAQWIKRFSQSVLDKDL